ncbi:Retrovirus-related Pol polyprotein from transposon 17.6 [Trichinella murrelli]|uniref:Retrovirus-related Pol polyprotein from transposon 17.6 n=1 Tax=Trichinella murrelli TaxID=144512 RepID=A0A0V0TCF9_9BILA|nr:Retrovirus-related Pol polyprotein from transposon 17.6 [Trichinella murrelli]
MQETHQYSTDIPQRDLSTSSHLDFIRCPSDAFYLLNIPFLSMTHRISSAGTGGNVTKRDHTPRRHRTIMQSMGVPNSAVNKRDGSCRFCVDYRQLNNVTQKDAHPLPRIDDTLDALSGAQWFPTDLASGYWQVEMETRDREKTAFTTPYGLYQFKVMPFGLCNAPASFQRLMETSLRGLVGSKCLVYLDDVIVFGRTAEEHTARLQEVLDRLRKVGLKVKPEKCQLMKRKVAYLGHIISEKGIATDPSKTRAVKEWQAPSCVSELRQFLGLASYYRKFVNGFATPILAYPDFRRRFLVDVDASGAGLGAVLSQKDGSKERVPLHCAKPTNTIHHNFVLVLSSRKTALCEQKPFRNDAVGNGATALRVGHVANWATLAGTAIHTLVANTAETSRNLGRVPKPSIRLEAASGAELAVTNAYVMEIVLGGTENLDELFQTFSAIVEFPSKLEKLGMPLPFNQYSNFGRLASVDTNWYLRSTELSVDGEPILYKLFSVFQNTFLQCLLLGIKNGHDLAAAIKTAEDLPSYIYNKETHPTRRMD